MKARVKATGEIVEVKVYKREHRLYIRTNGEKTGEIYRAKDLDFNIDGKFAENCLNGIKQGIVYGPDYWTRLEHQAVIAAMGGMCGNTKYNDYAFVDMAKLAIKAARTLVEKLKEKKE